MSELKKELRTYYLEKRKAFSVEEIQEKSEHIMCQFFEHVSLENVQVIHVFLPILTNNEVNTWKIILKVWKQFPELKIVVPVTDFRKKEMIHCLLEPDMELVENKYRIPEPIERHQVADAEIDVAITPLLVVNKELIRVGYGGGFYDRFFAKAKPSMKKIGVGFFAPIQETTWVESHDIALDQYLF